MTHCLLSLERIDTVPLPAGQCIALHGRMETEGGAAVVLDASVLIPLPKHLDAEGIRHVVQKVKEALGVC